MAEAGVAAMLAGHLRRPASPSDAAPRSLIAGRLPQVIGEQTLAVSAPAGDAPSATTGITAPPA